MSSSARRPSSLRQVYTADVGNILIPARSPRVRFSDPLEMGPSPSPPASPASSSSTFSYASRSTPPSSITPSRQSSRDSSSSCSGSSTRSILCTDFIPPAHGYLTFDDQPRPKWTRAWSTDKDIKSEMIDLESQKRLPLRYHVRHIRSKLDKRFQQAMHWSIITTRDVTLALAAIPLTLIPEPDDPLQMSNTKALFVNTAVMTPVALTALIVVPPTLLISALLSPLVTACFSAEVEPHF